MQKTSLIFCIEAVNKTLKIDFVSSKTRQQIDESIKKLQEYLTKIIDKTILWAKISSESKLIWFQNCFQMIVTFRQYRRKWTKNHLNENWQEYVKINDKKKKTIKKVKQIKFRKNIAKIISKNEIWKFAKWTGKKVNCQKKSQNCQIYVYTTLLQQNLMKKLRFETWI